jgi:ABC-type lipoprotein release transport system permease subunit
VQYASPIAATRFVILGQGHSAYGIDPSDFPNVGGYRKVIEGREVRSGLEAVIDQRLAEAGDFNVGDVIEAMGLSLPIVGICETGIPVRIFLPIDAVQEHIAHAERVTFFFVKCTSPEVIDATVRRIEETLPSLKAQTLSNYYRILTTTFRGLHQFIAAVISVALVITFMVILLTMYTAVVERTREIGILKSMGASRVHRTRDTGRVGGHLLGRGGAGGSGERADEGRHRVGFPTPHGGPPLVLAAARGCAGHPGWGSGGAVPGIAGCPA